MSTDPNAPASGVMSIREDFAKAAMQGILCGWASYIREEDEEWIANKAARLADALIAALNKETK